MGNLGRKFPAEPLTEAEVLALMRGCSQRAPTGIRNRALVMVMWRVGLRVSEALDLRPADVNPDRGTVRVLDGKGHKPRTVGIDDDALTAIQRWLDVRRTMGFRTGPLFCTLDGTHMQSNYVRAMMKRLGRKAGIDKRVHAHGLRHTNATELASEGVPVNVISKHLGHANSAVTARYLDHVAPADVIAVGRSRRPVGGDA
jgi:site-specific recombinase XerD